MPRLVLVTLIPAPMDIAFDLSRSIDVHVDTQTTHEERAIAGCTEGLIELGESVTWEAKHLGVRQQLESRVVAMDFPRSFRDSMVRGAFARFDHDHLFEPVEGGTQMTDIFDYTSPLGVLGSLADALFLRRYMLEQLTLRAEALRALAAETPHDELRARLDGRRADFAMSGLTAS